MTRSRIINLSLAIIILSVSLIGATPKARAAGASLYLSPSTGTYVIGSTFKIGVKVNSGGAEINAAEGSISYDKELLDVASVAKGNIFMFWTTEPSFGGGNIKFGGGNPSPYNGSAGGVLTITFKAKKAGLAQVRFTSGAVLANDGKGTNVLASMGSANYTISPKEEAPVSVPVDPAKPTNDTGSKETPKTGEEPKEDPVDDAEYNMPVVRSTTHPDSNKWYQDSDVKFAWELPDSTKGVSLSFDQKMTGDPGPESDGLIGEKDFTASEGGVWYLHIKLKDAAKWGSVAHYRVMIDKNPPASFTVKVGEMVTGSWPVLEFDAKDEESGLDRYELYVGSLEHQAYQLEADKKKMELANLEPGHHTVLVKAIDKAGNQRVETAEFVIEPIVTPTISDYSSEVKPSDRFYMSGSAPANSKVNINISKDNIFMASTSMMSDANGNWSYIHPDKLPEGRYMVDVEAVNDKGMRSSKSAEKSFLVSPPVFAVVGSFILDYFTVIVSLIFMGLLIVLIIFFLVYFVRRKLKKETIEVEDVLKRNLRSYRKELEEQMDTIIQKETRVTGKKDKLEIKEKLTQSLDLVEAKILKEVKDVEDILK